MRAKYKGILGELIASLYLMLKGFRIEKRRFKTYCGEIDIIASRRDLIIFVEVKSRKSMEKCFNAVKSRQLSRIRRASQIFLKRNALFVGRQIRYDVVLISSWRLPTHLENVCMH